MPYTDPNFEFPALRDAQSKLDAARKRMADVFTEAGPELDMSRVKCIPGSSEEKVEEIRKMNAELPDLKKKVEDLRDVARAAANPNLQGAKESGGRETKGTGAPRDFGAEFTRALPNLKTLKHQSQHLDIEVKTLFQRTAGWDPEDVRSGRVELTPLRPPVHVVSYIPSGSISQSDYKYMEETTHTATAVVEVAEAGTYGEAALALTERSKPVQKVAAWIPVTDEQLEDEPAARAYVESRMTAMIQRRLDSQVLVGDNTGANLHGTENIVGIQSQAKGTDTIMDAALKLFTLIRSDGFAEPTVAFINPTKWQDVLLTKTADGLYIWNHPSTTGPETLWGVPVVQTTAHTSTKIVAGDYGTYGMLFNRRGMDVQVTNSHGTLFIEGKQAIRADIRCVMVHFRPKAFGVVTGL